MFGKITDALHAIHSDLAHIAAGLNRASDTLQEAQSLPTEYLGLADRVTALEGELEAAIGQARGLITEAESRFAAARAAEERSRGMMKRAEKLQADLADGDEEGVEPLDYIRQFVPNGDVEGGGGEGVPPMRDRMADRLTGKQAARQAKFGF